MKIAWSKRDLDLFTRCDGARTAARVLLGWSPVRGKLPIRIPPAYPIGHGLTIADSTLAPVKPPAHVIIP